MMQKTIVAFKSVTDNLCSGHDSVKWKVGEWQKFEGELKLCSSGFHASRHPFDVLNYLQGNRLFKIDCSWSRLVIKQRKKPILAYDIKLKH